MESSKTLTTTHLENDKEDLGFVEQGLHDLPSPMQSKVPGHDSCPQGNHISREEEKGNLHRAKVVQLKMTKSILPPSVSNHSQHSTHWGVP